VVVGEEFPLEPGKLVLRQFLTQKLPKKLRSVSWQIKKRSGPKGIPGLILLI